MNPVSSRSGFQVVGIETRTNNFLEAEPDNARIGKLWQRFAEDKIAESIENQTEPGRVYAVYTDYEDGDDEDYSLVIGCAVESVSSVPDNMVLVNVAMGTYQHFLSEGDMPLALVKTWGTIWEFYSDSEQYRRVFTTDYEIHDPDRPNEVDVFVAVEPL